MRRTNLLRYLATTLFSVSIATFAASSCTLITDSDIAPGGIGQPCKDDSDCQGASCDDGGCVAACEADGDCPAPTKCRGKRCIMDAAVGQACTNNAQCEGADCQDGLCTAACTTDAQCPAPSKCLDSTCQQPLKVAGIWIGLAASAEGWTLTHHEGMLASKEKLGYVDYVYGEGLLGDPANAAVDKFIEEGAQVIIANSWDYLQMVKDKAAQYPDVKFLHCSGLPREPNVASFFAHMENAWYVAGRIAARKSLTDHIGFIGSYNNGEVVRHINSFALGAKKEKPNIKVEVRWVGFWYDVAFDTPMWEYTPLHMGDQAVKKKMTAEEYLTAKLIDSGADVITHNLDNQLASRYVGIHTTAGTLKDPKDTTKNFAVWTIANDNYYGWRDSTGEPYVHAIGTTYWNWEPAYSEIFEDIHRGRFVPKDYMYPLTPDATTSIVSFGLSTAETDITTLSLKSLLEDAAKIEDLFTGPIKQTGQRAGGDIPAGTAIEEKEWRTMCWFVDGVVERANPNDFASELVPAKVPTVGHVGKMGDAAEPPAGTPRQPTTAPEILVDLGSGGAIWDCNANSAIAD